jgi:hypothetical protein
VPSLAKSRGAITSSNRALRDGKRSDGVVYLSTDGVVQRYGGVWSAYVIRRQARNGLLPHTKLPGRRDLLFPITDLERYERGEVELETVKLPNGGRICRPREARPGIRRGA